MNLFNGRISKVLLAQVITSPDGTQSWFLDGRRHRDDGPAVTWSSGIQSWWINGRLHREDGPAVIYSDGRQEFWVNGIQLDPAGRTQ